MSKELTRRLFLRALPQLAIAGLTGAAAGQLSTPEPSMAVEPERVERLEKGAMDQADRLVLTNQRVNQVSDVLITVRRDVKVIRQALNL